jgi:hypothetical protein
VPQGDFFIGGIMNDAAGVHALCGFQQLPGQSRVGFRFSRHVAPRSKVLLDFLRVRGDRAGGKKKERKEESVLSC